MTTDEAKKVAKRQLTCVRCECQATHILLNSLDVTMVCEAYPTCKPPVKSLGQILCESQAIPWESTTETARAMFEKHAAHVAFAVRHRAIESLKNSEFNEYAPICRALGWGESGWDDQ